MVPIPPIPRQSRSLDAVDGTNVTGADHRHEALEPRPFHAARSGAAKVIVDHRHGRKACSLCSARQVVLPALAFEIADDLRHGRLTNIDHCGAREMSRRYLTAHRRLPSRPVPLRASPMPPTEDPPGSRRAPWCLLLLTFA